jgi:hypothetical protein
MICFTLHFSPYKPSGHQVVKERDFATEEDLATWVDDNAESIQLLSVTEANSD